MSDPIQVPTRAVPYELAGRKRLPDFVAKRLFGAPLAPSREEWARVVAALGRGDAPMDRVVSWMFESGPSEARSMFERALTLGISSVEAVPAPLRELFEQVERAPAWLDGELLARGSATLQAAGLVNFYVLRDLALMGGYARFNSMNQTLAATGALSGDVARRLAGTGKWLDDVTRPGGLERGGDGFISTIRVRLVHAMVRRSLLARGNWDVAVWGLPINQMDMVATYLGFGPVLVMGARLFGVPVSREDSRAAMHLWRYVGWLSGVEDEWLARTERDGMRTLHHASLTHFLPDEKIGLLGAALRDEPLTRPLPRLERYPRLARVVRRYLYHQHLSNAALTLDGAARRRVGVPVLAVPWYPLLSAPPRFLVHCGYRLAGDKGRERLRQRGAARQQRLLASYLSKERP